MDQNNGIDETKLRTCMWAGGGELQRARFSASWLNSLVLAKLGCSQAFMNEQEISRVISKKPIWLRITLLPYQSCKVISAPERSRQHGTWDTWISMPFSQKIPKLSEGGMVITPNYSECSSTIKMNHRRVWGFGELSHIFSWDQIQIWEYTF